MMGGIGGGGVNQRVFTILQEKGYADIILLEGRSKQAVGGRSAVGLLSVDIIIVITITIMTVF